MISSKRLAAMLVIALALLSPHAQSGGVAAPDVEVTAVHWAPTVAWANRPVILSITVKNTGTKTVDGLEFAVTFAGKPLGAFTKTRWFGYPVEPGKSVTIHVYNFTAPKTPGAYPLAVSVAAGSVVAISQETLHDPKYLPADLPAQKTAITGPAAVDPSRQVTATVRVAVKGSPFPKPTIGGQGIPVTGPGFVANKCSHPPTRFHKPSCPYAQGIPTECRIMYPTKEAARKAGYTPCTVCKP